MELKARPENLFDKAFVQSELGSSGGAVSGGEGVLREGNERNWWWTVLLSWCGTYSMIAMP